jgi:hypothetical protein
MADFRRQRELYERILSENVRCVVLRRWPWNYHCGIWQKHKPDANGREYDIILNRTRGVECGKVTLIHEIEHIRDDLEGTARTNPIVEGRALQFYKRNKRFVASLWERYVQD